MPHGRRFLTASRPYAPEDADALRGALARVVASEPFRNAPRLVSFLSFIVDKTIAGEAGGLKGYTIATQALGRRDDFDPQADPIVRVEAGRLRRALQAYYEGEGAEDPLRIVVPVGSYVPLLEERGELVADMTPAESDPPEEGAAPALPAPADDRPRRSVRGLLRSAWARAAGAAAVCLLALGTVWFVHLAADRDEPGAAPDLAAVERGRAPDRRHAAGAHRGATCRRASRRRSCAASSPMRSRNSTGSS